MHAPAQVSATALSWRVHVQPRGDCVAALIAVMPETQLLDRPAWGGDARTAERRSRPAAVCYPHLHAVFSIFSCSGLGMSARRAIHRRPVPYPTRISSAPIVASCLNPVSRSAWTTPPLSRSPGDGVPEACSRYGRRHRPSPWDGSAHPSAPPPRSPPPWPCATHPKLPPLPIPASQRARPPCQRPTSPLVLPVYVSAWEGNGVSRASGRVCAAGAAPPS